MEASVVIKALKWSDAAALLFEASMREGIHCFLQAFVEMKYPPEAFSEPNNKIIVYMYYASYLMLHYYCQYTLIHQYSCVIRVLADFKWQFWCPYVLRLFCTSGSCIMDQ